MMKTFLLSIVAMAFATSATAHNFDKPRWHEHKDEVLKLWTDNGGTMENTVYGWFDYDNDGLDELVVYQILSEMNVNSCLFCLGSGKVQLVSNSFMPRPWYTKSNEGTYFVYGITIENEEGEIISSTPALLNKSICRELKNEIDDDNLEEFMHGRHMLHSDILDVKPFEDFLEKPLPMECQREDDEELYIFHLNKMWYRFTPKVNDGINIKSFFTSIAQALNETYLNQGLNAINGIRNEDNERVENTTVDSKAGYIHIDYKNYIDDENIKPDYIECCYWKTHYVSYQFKSDYIVALNYKINTADQIIGGTFRGLYFYAYNEKNQTLVPLTDTPVMGMPNLNYNIDIELPRQGKNIKVIDHETGEEYVLGHSDGSFISWSQKSEWLSQEGLSVFVLDNSGTDTNIRNRPGGKVIDTIYSAGNPEAYALTVDVCKNGAFRIVGNVYERLQADCDNLSEITTDATGESWIHSSCIAVRTRHNGGAAVKLLATPTEGDGKVVYTITKEQKLRPVDYRADGWVKLRTLDGKHEGWTTVEYISGIPWAPGNAPSIYDEE